MAIVDYESWVPEEWGSTVIETVQQMSAIEALGREETMNTDTKNVPRSGGMTVDVTDKGGTYDEEDTSDDEVTLRARKFTKAIRLADEDIKDTASTANILDQKKKDWAKAFAKGYDNACLATIGTQSMASSRPFTSLYQELRTTNADLGYTADENYMAEASITYAVLSELFGLYEDSDWYDETNTTVIASPAYKRYLRDIVDDQNRPIFVQGREGTPDTLFGEAIKWSPGARTSTAMTASPTGNPLLVVGNRTLLVRGVRSGPESFVAGADTGIGFLTDSAVMKLRARRGFTVGHPSGLAMIEKSAS
jgi:HK97 family phage major capsid protein